MDKELFNQHCGACGVPKKCTEAGECLLKAEAKTINPHALPELAFIAGAERRQGEIAQLQKDNAAQAEALRRTAEKCDRYREKVASLEQAVDEWVERDGKADEEITRLKGENRELTLALRRLQSYCLHFVRAYQQTGRCKEVEAVLDRYHHSTIEP